VTKFAVGSCCIAKVDLAEDGTYTFLEGLVGDKRMLELSGAAVKFADTLVDAVNVMSESVARRRDVHGILALDRAERLIGEGVPEPVMRPARGRNRGMRR